MITKVVNRIHVINLGGALLTAALFKVSLLTRGAFPFNSDEAIVALMARHILQVERPVFFYGQFYMGSLDAWFVAGVFRALGESVGGVRLVQVVLYLLYITSLWGMARFFSPEKRVASIVVWLAAIPTVMVTTYTTITLGGYGEILVLGNLILWLGYRVIYGGWERRIWAWTLLGAISGLAFWTLGMAGIYILPVTVLGLWKHRHKLAPYYLACAAGFIVGSSPWWVENIVNRGASLDVLLKSSLPPSTFLTNLTVLLFFDIPALLGFRSPSSSQYLPWPLLLVGVIFYLSVLAYVVRSWRRRKLDVSPGVLALLGCLVLLFAVVILSSNYGIDLTARYYLPLYLPLLLMTSFFIAAAWRKRPLLGGCLLVLVMGINVFANYQVAISEEKFTDQFTEITMFDNRYDAELIAFLKDNGELKGYTNYWVSFRLAFLSGEQIIYLAKLPYKSDLYYNPLNNRYPAYEEIVETSNRVAYITTRHPRLDELIRGHLNALGVSYSERQIGDFHIFYELSRAVRPVEIGLGYEYPR
jgi:4-amino-4-deoxy-L-arabinose transferase-like glycosyltransferase